MYTVCDYTYIHTYIYTYIHMHKCVHVHICIYTHIQTTITCIHTQLKGSPAM